MRIAVGSGDIDTVDPAATNSGVMYQLEYDTGLNLVRYADAGGTRGLRIVPDAATGMPRIRDHGRVYTFRIRTGLRFSPPSNQPVTAATFKHTLERVFRVGAATTFQGILEFDFAGHVKFENGAPGISGITAHGQRLTIRLTGNDRDLLARLALPPFTAVPTNWSDPNATGSVPSAGPYYIRRFTAGRIQFVRNPNYRGPRTGRLPSFTVTESGDPWQAVQHGQAAYAVDGDAATPKQRQALVARLGPGSAAATAGHQQLYVNPYPGVLFISMQTSTGPFANPLVRQAVNYAVDRPALTAALGYPAAVTDQYLPPDMPGFPGNGLIYPLNGPDVRKARQLMRRAGVRLPLRAIYYTSNDPRAVTRTRILKHDLNAIGIQIHARTVPFQTLQQAHDNPVPYPLIDGSFQFLVADPSFLLVQPPRDLPTGPLTSGFNAAAMLSGSRRYAAFGRLDLQLAKSYAPAAAYAYQQHIDFFAPQVGCQLYQPIFGIEIGRLCRRR